MVTRTIVALLLATAALGCRDDGKQIVIVHLLQTRADAVDYLAVNEIQIGRAEAFEQAVIRTVATSRDCGPILIARGGQGRDAGPVQDDLVRRPHWDLTIAWIADDTRQSWVLAGDGFKVLREGMGSAQDIGRAVCLQSSEAGGGGPGRVSAR
jgi:hypothetical protein